MLVRVVIGDESSEVVSVVDVEDRDPCSGFRV